MPTIFLCIGGTGTLLCNLCIWHLQDCNVFQHLIFLIILEIFEKLIFFQFTCNCCKNNVKLIILHILFLQRCILQNLAIKICRISCLTNSFNNTYFLIQGKNVYRQNVYWTKCLWDKMSTGKKAYWDKTSTRQNVYGTKGLRDKTSIGTKHLMGQNI